MKIKVSKHLEIGSMALIFFWLALTGGYSGWGQRPLLLINILLWMGLGWQLWRGRLSAMRVENYFSLFIAAMILSAIATGAGPRSLVNVTIWLVYLGLYHLARRWPDEIIHRAAFMAFFPYALLAFLPWENVNVISFNVLGLALLGLPIFGSAAIYLLIGVGLILLYLGNIGGLLALLVAIVVYLAHWDGRWRWSVLAALPLLIAGWWVSPGSYTWRLQFWAAAWQGFLSSPLWGLGPGQYYLLNTWPHAHNIFATTAAETGLIGLLTLSLLVWSVVQRWTTLPTWAAALVAAYGAWALVDDPLHIWGAGAIFFIALSRLEDKVEKPFDPTGLSKE